MIKILGKMTKILGKMTQLPGEMTSNDEPFGLSVNFTMERAKIYFISPVERTSIENTS